MNQRGLKIFQSENCQSPAQLAISRIRSFFEVQRGEDTREKGFLYKTTLLRIENHRRKMVVRFAVIEPAQVKTVIAPKSTMPSK